MGVVNGNGTGTARLILAALGVALTICCLIAGIATYVPSQVDEKINRHYEHDHTPILKALDSIDSKLGNIQRDIHQLDIKVVQLQVVRP